MKTMLIRNLLAALSVFLFAIPLSYSDENKPIGNAVKDLPIFDAHMHYHEPAWADVSPSRVLELMDRNRISRSLLSSGPDEGTVRLHKFAPNRFVPEASPYHGAIGKGNWTTADGIFDYMIRRLDSHPHRGMGELIINSVDADNEVLVKQLSLLAQSRNLLMHIHADYKVIETVYRHAPGLTIIWAHAGMVDPTDVISKTMDKYETLYADLSYREHQILDGSGRLDAAWKELLIKHADRFMVGSDTWANDRWAEYDDLIGTNRKWLALMPRVQAEMIAYKNAERVFKKKMSTDLIGTR